MKLSLLSLTIITLFSQAHASTLTIPKGKSFTPWYNNMHADFVSVASAAKGELSCVTALHTTGMSEDFFCTNSGGHCLVNETTSFAMEERNDFTRTYRECLESEKEEDQGPATCVRYGEKREIRYTQWNGRSRNGIKIFLECKKTVALGSVQPVTASEMESLELFTIE